jgi:predicted phosphate transport protein (TIGR00153 family)
LLLVTDLKIVSWILPRGREAHMLGWFQALMPKEMRFFELFVRHATIVVAGAEALRGLLQGGDKIEYYSKMIFEREAEADEITRQVLTAVRRTFITPFDRTDIQDLVTSMDDAIDQMNRTAKTITMFEVRGFDPQMQQMGDVILQAAHLVLEAMPLLSSIGGNATQLNALTEKIIHIEEYADQLYEQGRKSLFLANRQGAAKGNAMNGVEDYAANAVTRLLRGDRRRDYAFCCDRSRHPSLDHAHHHWICRRCRRSPQSVSGSLECCEQHRDCLGRDAACRGHSSRSFLFTVRSAPMTQARTGVRGARW